VSKKRQDSLFCSKNRPRAWEERPGTTRWRGKRTSVYYRASGTMKKRSPKLSANDAKKAGGNTGDEKERPSLRPRPKRGEERTDPRLLRGKKQKTEGFRKEERQKSGAVRGRDTEARGGEAGGRRSLLRLIEEKLPALCHLLKEYRRSHWK